MDSETTNNDLSPEEKIRKLEATVKQLKNVIVKLTGQDLDSNSKRSKKKPRKFDFNLYKLFVWIFHCYATYWGHLCYFVLLVKLCIPSTYIL